MGRPLLFFCGMVASAAACAQVDSTEQRLPPPYIGEHHDAITLLAGYHQGLHGFGELGIGRNTYGFMHHPYDLGYYAGAELRTDRPQLWGVKVGAYVDGGAAMGLHLIQYFEGSDACTVFRPEIGLGMWKAKVTYAYNVGITPRLDGINTHMVSLSFAFRVLRLKGDNDHRSKRPVATP